MAFLKKYVFAMWGVFMLSFFFAPTSLVFAQSTTWNLWFTPKSITATTAERIAVLAWDIPTGMSGVIVCNGVIAYDAFSAPSSSAKALTFDDAASGTRTCTLRDATGSTKGIATVTVVARTAGICTGIPAFSVVCPGDDAGFATNTTSTVVASAASCSAPAGSAPKCEYYCDATHKKSGNTCATTSEGAACSGSYGTLTNQMGTCLTTAGAKCSSSEVTIDTSVSGGKVCPSGMLCCGTVTVDPTTPTTSAATTCSGSNPGLVPCGRSCDDPATTDVNEAGICTLCHLLLLMKNITSWIFMVMTYIAFAVLVAMGILYIVSAGNTQMITLAKGGIKATLYGFAIVLLGWVAINVILMVLADGALGTDTASFSIKTNGSWFEYKCDATSKYVRTGITGGSGTGGGTTPTGPGGNLDCKTGKCATNPEIADAVKKNASGADPNVVMAIIDAGEGCNKNKSPAGACGYGQTMHAKGAMIRPWCGIPGTPEQTCAAVQTDLQLDINCAAKLIKEDGPMKKCFAEGGVKLLAACYNRGRAAAIKGDCGEGSPPYCERVKTYYDSCK